jgi:LCP family protein required for cell wall assembly
MPNSFRMEDDNTIPIYPRSSGQGEGTSPAAATSNGSVRRYESVYQHASTLRSMPPVTQPQQPHNGAAPLPLPPVETSAYVPPRTRRRSRRRRNHVEWAWVVIALALLSVVIVLSMSVTLLVRATTQGIAVMPTAVAALPTAVDARLNYDQFGGLVIGSQVTLDDGRSIVLQPWNGSSRFTVLVMGMDRRPGETGLAYRTDTMMLVSLDPRSQRLGILSIPRDLYVEVPGYGQLQRVNSALVLGELQQTNYGPTLAMQTVQYNFGIRIHNYILLDFNGVINLIDLIGGIDIVVPYDIIDYDYPDMNYGYDPLILRAGPQHMDGATALKFARTRHNDNDFERARRQQLVLYAIRDRILNYDMLPQLILQSPSILRTLNNHVYTGLSIEQIIQLALYLRDIPSENIVTGVLDSNYIMGYTTPQGAQVLVPRRAQLSQLFTEVFGANYSE